MSSEWEIWGPMGGYVAACAFRAAGESSGFDRPATFSCHFLGVAEFGPVDLRVETRKSGKTAASQRVEVSQGDRKILDAAVWSIGDVEGLEHDETVAPDVPDPDDLPFINELLPDDAAPAFPFWNNLEAKPLRIRDRVAAGRSASGGMARMAAVRADGDLRRPLGRRGAIGDPRRPSELAVGAPAARLEAAAVHRADARSARRLPSADDGQGLAAVRRHRAALHGRPVRLDVARMVAGRGAARVGRRAMPVPPYAPLTPLPRDALRRDPLRARAASISARTVTGGRQGVRDREDWPGCHGSLPGTAT